MKIYIKKSYKTRAAERLIHCNSLELLWFIFRHPDDFIALTAVIRTYSIEKDLPSLKFKPGHTYAGNKAHISNSMRVQLPSEPVSR